MENNMFFTAISFLLGDLLFQQLHVLPNFSMNISLLICALVLVWMRRLSCISWLLFACISGFLWAEWQAHHLLSIKLDKNMEEKTILITGTIVTLPKVEEKIAHFEFELTNIEWADISIAKNMRVKLSWYHPDIPLNVGGRYQFYARLKRIHSCQNPGTFDQEAWYLQHGIRAQGYIVQNQQNQLLVNNRFTMPIQQLRQYLQYYIYKLLPASETAPWLMALMIGERSQIPPHHWDILRRTGTNHLMAIAGLHLGFIALITHFIFNKIWRWWPRGLLLIPAQQVAILGAVVSVLFYSALAGFSIPTQRASLMFIIFSYATFMKSSINPWQSWSLALFIIILIQPLSVLSEGFWLSFATLALLIFHMRGRLAPQGMWWNWGRAQWIIGLGLIPFTIYFFHEFPLLSFVANLIAIPWLTFTILPFTFISTVLILIHPAWASCFLAFADKNLSLLWIFLTWVAKCPSFSWQQFYPTMNLLLASMIGSTLLLLPHRTPGRIMGLFWMLPLWFYSPQLPKNGELWLTLLDVGQGLSVVVQTKHHMLLYDTGPKYSEQFNMGKHVVVPFLRSIKTNNIDMLVISHGDNDHIGGASSVMEAFNVNEIKTSVTERFKFKNTSLCLEKEKWQWDNINFEFLYPDKSNLNLGNDSSCVLLIDNGTQQILLSGDIEKWAERRMLKKNKLSPTAILVAPHHGSKTSGLRKFMETLRPQIVLYAVGYRNRYHFPHPSVVKSYKQIESQQLDTSTSGAIQIKLSQKEASIKPESFRNQHHHYWF